VCVNRVRGRYFFFSSVIPAAFAASSYFASDSA